MCLPLLFCVLFVSAKAVKQMHEERKQMLQKIIDNDEQWEKAKEEVTQVVAHHGVTQTKLEEQEQVTFMEEQRARVSGNICTCSPYTAWVTVCKKSARYLMLSAVLCSALSMFLQKEIETLRKDLTGQVTALELLKVNSRGASESPLRPSTFYRVRVEEKFNDKTVSSRFKLKSSKYVTTFLQTF